MSHAITMINGQASMAYQGETPWHGLGQSLDPTATFDDWLTAAGLDYKVCRSCVRYGEGDNTHIWNERHVFFRSDTKQPLGIGSDGYQLVQPREVLDFFKRGCDANDLTLETAGTLYDGARYWALARTHNTTTLPGNDRINGYILLATSCDGSMATTGMETAVRVVCNNTLQLALDRGKSAIKVRHSTRFDATQMQVDLGLVEKHFDTFATSAHRLAARKLTNREAANVLIAALGDPEKDAKEQPRICGQIYHTWKTDAIGRDLPSSQDTAWGLVNAATQHFDHTAGRSQQTRLQSAWFGPYAASKQSVYQAALATVSVDHPITLDEVLAATAGSA